ncbi:HAUS augmin-like complex subunit 5 isoform X2 [Babylonia areolata]|uniref:HAUS augmin-like complex subunit 5 isoform X2 n=1 Tax=Babylonia areolata TaxID=304850 RepID=UPI003FD2F06C
MVRNTGRLLSKTDIHLIQGDMMSAGGQERDLATQLHQWAIREMHFHPQGVFLGAPPPTVEQLRKICRGSCQSDLWNYVINNVHSVQTMKKVKGNLQLKARSHRQSYTVKYRSHCRYDDEQQSLFTQRAQLQADRTVVLLEIQQLEQELERMEADVQSAELEYQKELEGVRDMGRRTCLLQLYSHTSDNLSANLDAFSDRVLARTDVLVSRRKGVDTALHSQQEGQDTEGRMPQLETSASRDVRMSCDHISRFLHQTLQGTFSKDKTSFQLNKEQLWKQVETTLNDHNIEEIVTALVFQSKQEAMLLREHTMKINIQNEAQKLRFQYEKGGVLTDTAPQPSLLHSVHQLLEENQLQHVMRFVEMEKHHNKARPLLQHLHNTRTKIHSLLHHHFSTQPGHAHIGCLWVQGQLDEVGERTARDTYREQAERLRERVAGEQACRDTLLTLHRKIQDFQELANAKQNLIQVVAKQNAGAKSRLAAQHVDVTDYISRSIPTHPMETQMLTAGLSGTVVQEVNKLSALSLPYLLHLHLDSETKRGLLDMSINFTTHPTAISVRQPLLSALSHLHFPLHKAGECVLKQCLALKEQQQSHQQWTQTQTALCSSVQLSTGVHTDLDNLAELCDKVKNKDQQELEKLLPVLQKRLNKAARASTKCIKVKDFVQAWWEQPAQFSTPWVTMEGLTFQQWFNKWKIIVTNIRQLDLHHSTAGGTTNV